MNSKLTNFVLIVTAVAGGALGDSVFAAGFALSEQSASGLGNAYAGAAAIAEDASTIFFNPAGLTRLSGKQWMVGGNLIAPSIKFSNNGNSTAPATIGTLGGDGGNAGVAALVPNFYFSMPIGDQLAFGVGVSVPFGLATEYDSNWVGRFQGIKSDIKTLNINPALAIKINDVVSLGAGIDYQAIKAELTNKINGAAINGAFAGQEFGSKLTADDTAWGYNFGILVQAGPNTRFGASYRSKIEYTLEGSADVTTPTGTPFVPASGPSTADLTLPDSFSVSLVQRIGERTEMLLDVTHTSWSKIKDLKVLNSTNGATRETLVLNFEDTYRYSIGVNHQCTDRFTAKLGLALDKSPVNDANRTVRLPDNDRTWLAVGGKWKVGEQGTLDFGFAHLFVKDAPINQARTSAAAYGRVAGTYEGSINILSAQYAMTF